MTRFILVLFFLLAPASLFAAVPERCVDSSSCNKGDVCIEGNCLEDGLVTVTLSWPTNIDLDLRVETPSGLILGPGKSDATTGEDGRVVAPACYKDGCKDDMRDANYPHVEHVVWNTVVHPGKYWISATNFAGGEAGPIKVVFRHPDGREENSVWEVGNKEGDESTLRLFVVEEQECKKDTDGDGLCDLWETQGIDLNNDGVIDLDLKKLGADPKHKDLFVEVDWLKGQKPMPLTAVIKSFAQAPVSNPDGKKGIKLHILISDEITTLNKVAVTDTQTVGPEDLKDIAYDGKKFACGWFGSKADRKSDNCEWISKAREKVYRYVVYAYEHNDKDGTLGHASGTPGRGFVVTSGHFKEYNSEVMLGDTFMHELGHTIGLRHGGADNINCKPNYLSNMNYIYDLLAYPRKVDYSIIALPTLDESALLEKKGVQAPKNWKTIFYQANGADVTHTIDKTQEIDWNGVDGIESGTVEENISMVDFGNCSGDTEISILTSQNDWEHIVLDFRPSAGDRFKKLPPLPKSEPTDEEKLAFAAKMDSDGDGVNNKDDVCISIADPGQEDSDGDGLGDACDGCPDDAAPRYATGCPPGMEPVVKIPEEGAMGSDGESDGKGTNADGTSDDEEESPELVSAKSDGCSTTRQAPSSLLFLLFGFFAIRIRRKSRKV